jgi:SAM-dependent methyltransferase
LPNIYGRLDSVEEKLRNITQQADLIDQVAEYMFLFELRMKEHHQAILRDEIATVNAAFTEARDRITDIQTGILEHLNARSTELTLQTDRKLEEVRNWIEEVQSGILEHLNARSTELTLQTDQQIRDLGSRLDDVGLGHLVLQRSIADLRSTSSQSRAHITDENGAHGDLDFDPALYQRFEDRFRGAEGEIKGRQAEYVHILSSSLALGRALDIGCGRGEWLELVSAAGFEAYGIDSNPVSVNRCVEKGLKVEIGDALDHLRSLNEDSLGVVSLFQVLEHVPVNDLSALLKEVLRVLMPGGAVVAEFPNIQSLRVGAGSFWLDPTHVRPLHPLFVEFLAREVGYASIHLHYPTWDGDEVSKESAVLSSPDVALIALK